MKPFLRLLKHLERTGRIPNTFKGLCSCVSYFFASDSLEKIIFDGFSPTGKEKRMLKKENKDPVYWGSDSEWEESGIATDLRKTIVTFCAAINNEL